MNKLTQKEVFKRLDVFTTGTTHFWETLNEISGYMENSVTEISDDEAWIIINFLDRILLQVTDGYWSDFMNLVLESAPGWPYGNEFLLRIPQGSGGGIVDIKSEALTDEARLQIDSSGLPFGYKPVGLNLEDYWGRINWGELSEEEFRFLLIVISNRGKNLLESLPKSSAVSLAISKFQGILNKLDKNEKAGLRWLSESNQ